MPEAAVTPHAEGKLNTKHGSVVHVPYKPNRLYYRPETGEILLVPEKDAAEFEMHGFGMCKAVDDLHLCNIAMSEALAAYSAKQNSVDPKEALRAKKDFEAAQEALNKASEALKVKIKPLAKLATAGVSIVELIPLSKVSHKGQPVLDASGKQTTRQYGKKMTFVTSEKIKNHWRTYPLNKDEKKAGGKNVLSAEDGKHKIDKEKILKQLKEHKTKIKFEFAEFEEHSVNGVLTDWATEWNKNLKYEHQGIGSHFTNNVDLGGEAQLMRYMAGVGSDVSWSPESGKAGLKAEAKAEFSLAEAKGNMTLYAPNRTGWVLEFTGKAGVKYPLGSIRAQLQLVLAGVVGASAVAELAAEVELSPKKIGMRGVPAESKKLFEMDKDKGIEIAGREAKVVPLKAELAVFAGAKADLDLNGSVQWLNPEKPERKFRDFVKVAPGVSGMAGAGASAKFEVSYEGGKFRILMAASVCIGVGARGKLMCEANANMIAEFIVWFFYQLYHANYEMLDFISAEAFASVKNIQFLAIQSGKKLEEFLLRDAIEIANVVNELLQTFEKAVERDELANRVLSSPAMLAHSTPETKGMLIYQLTRHSKADWVDSDNYEGADAYGYRKKAVVLILTWVQTRAEWDNVFQHMTATGTSTKEDTQAHVGRFLKLGIHDMDDVLRTIELRLKLQPSRGYRVAMNDTHLYQMFDTDSQDFTMLASLEPLGAGQNQAATSTLA